MNSKQAIVMSAQLKTFKPRQFQNEFALIEHIAKSCSGKRTAMLTGNYTVKPGPNAKPGDSRLLGERMLLTLELCARVYRKCTSLGIIPPALFIFPNDIVPGTFATNEEEREFKSAFKLPKVIVQIVQDVGITQDPLYFFTRDFSLSHRQISSRINNMRRKIAGGSENLIVSFESFVQNMASHALKKKKPKHLDQCVAGYDGEKNIFADASIIETSTEKKLSERANVGITNPNGSPYCSFIGATLFSELEKLGFTQMINTWVYKEYPCVDKAAAAYIYMYGGKMPIRNIFLDGADIILDHTIS